MAGGDETMNGQEKTGNRCEGGDVHWWYERMLVLVPWVLLAPSTVISQLPSEQSGADRLVTLGLVGLAAGWVYAWHTRASAQRRTQTGPMLTYFAGLLILFVALMSRDLVFILFTITGFFHAYLLRPWPLGVAGVFGTSVALNTMAMGPLELAADSISVYVGVIAIQTVAIGAGIVFAEKASEHDKRREALVSKLEAALAENAGLHSQLLTQAREAGVLDERQRLAREIHDTLAQALAGIVVQMQAAQRMWHSPEQARPFVDRTLRLAREGLAEARRSVQALRPQALEDARLPDALGDLARNWAEEAKVGVQVEVTGDRMPLSPPIEVALFRVAQEALTNVSKHAKATRVGVTLSYLGDVVLLDIRDDGQGIGERNGHGFGINSMTQRIRSVGGAVEIESGPGEGTAISASVPAISGSAQ